MYEYLYARCPRCGGNHEGQSLGTILVKETISIQYSTKPNIAVGSVDFCPHCKYVSKIWLDKDNAAKHGIQEHMIRNCWKDMPSPAYTIRELKAGTTKGAVHSVPDIDYDPDKTISDGSQEREYE